MAQRTTPTYHYLHQVINRFYFQHVTLRKIEKAIDTLKPKTSSDIDNISANLAQFCKKELSGLLTDIIKKSLQQGIFPDQLKVTRIYQSTETDRQLKLIINLSHLYQPSPKL